MHLLAVVDLAVTLAPALNVLSMNDLTFNRSSGSSNIVGKVLQLLRADVCVAVKSQMKN